MRIAWLAPLLALAGSRAASAQGSDGNPQVLQAAAPLEVAIGETVARDVGFAVGLICDDSSILRADLRTADSGTNVFEVTGVRLGDTVCRAGTAPTRPSFVFRVHVVEARRR